LTMISGDRIRQAREIKGITQAELAKAAGVDQSHISLLERDAREPSQAVLEKISLSTGFPIAFFRREPGPGFPLGSLLFRKRKSAQVPQIELDQLRQVSRLMFEVWRAMSEEFKEIDIRVPRIPGEKNPTRAAKITRAALGLSPDTPIKHLITTLEKSGVSVIELQSDTEDHDAFSLWVDTEPRTPVIVIIGVKSGDRCRFSVAHELGHLVLHQTISQPLRRLEDDAHAFASEFLLPEETIKQELQTPVTLTALAEMKGRWGVSMQALLLKAHDMSLITDGQRNYLYKQMGIRRWVKNEPVSFPAERPRLLQKMAERLYGVPIDYAKIASKWQIPVQLMGQQLGLETEGRLSPISASQQTSNLLDFKDFVSGRRRQRPRGGHRPLAASQDLRHHPRGNAVQPG
jgi:Zn-dependent peptidase ImmA (M78 family)/transcriptional regulator with XRE-family HTH domain